MKILKKNQFNIIYGAIFSAVTIASLLIITMTLSSQSQKIEDLQGSLKVQTNQMNKINTQLAAYRRGNPNLLTDCLNRATSTYENYIKTNGAPNKSKDGSTAYKLDSDEWAKADKDLKDARSKCQATYGE